MRGFTIALYKNKNYHPQENPMSVFNGGDAENKSSKSELSRRTLFGGLAAAATILPLAVQAQPRMERPPQLPVGMSPGQQRTMQGGTG